MNQERIWPLVLMVWGFGMAAIFLGLILFADLSENVEIIAVVGESVGIGIGSIGLGGKLTQRRNQPPR